MRLINADAYIADMKERQRAAWKWRNESIAEEDEVKLARAEGAFTAFTEAKLTLDAQPTIDSIYGYKIENLILAAETLSKEWVSPRDLANYHENLKLAFKIVREEQEKAIEKYVEGIGADI